MAAVITSLRDLVPIKPLAPTEALRVAELQANRLIELAGITAPPVPDTVITDLPRLLVEKIPPSAASGMSHWSKGRWLILLSKSEPAVRQRFTLAHEFKHVLDHPFITVLYPDKNGVLSHDRAEQVCNYFAACLLMPRQWVCDLYPASGADSARSLARTFGVSPAAMRVRLRQLHLDVDGGRRRRSA